MDFQAQSEKEIAEANLLPKAEYSFEVMKAEDKKSKSGNPMIELVVGIYTPQGKMRKVKDYLVAAMAAKLRHFCDATGLLHQYQNGTLCAGDCEGRTGTCVLEIKEASNGYPAKNQIQDYKTRPAKPLSNQEESQSASKEDDNLPF